MNKRLVHGVGVYEKGNYINSEKHKKCYDLWSGMLRRCYCKSELIRMPHYKDCEVCEEWLYFSNFEKWYNKQKYAYKDNYQLDKDILCKGNKIYSPKYCVLVPKEINMLLVKRNKCRGNLPIGVSIDTKYKHCRKYRVACSNGNGKTIRLGEYDTVEEAFNVYKQYKENIIKEKSQEYYDKGLINYKTYKALMKYKVNIDD